ncbi:hypothetical protein IJT17_01385 [bacterium]|nr:hypothetical protein [bacterium]
MDVIITSNSPGELSAWVAPFVACLRQRHPDWHIYLALVPCPFATGREAEYARRIEGLAAIWTPWQTLKILLGGRLPVPRAERGLVVYLGGEAWHAWGLSRRWRYPWAAYAVRDNWLWRKCSRVASQRLDLALKLEAAGVCAAHVGFIGWPAPQRQGESSEDLCIGIFPGSRMLMLRYTLGPFLELIRLLKLRLPQARFILAVSPFVSRQDVEGILRRPGRCGLAYRTGALCGNTLQIESGPEVEVCWGEPRRAIEQIDAAISVPGTNTGEIAAAGRALIVGLSCNIPVPSGGLGWLLERIGISRWLRSWHMRRYKRERFASLPNRWAGEMIAPEIIADDDLTDLANRVAELFADPLKRDELGRRLALTMGDPGEAVRRLTGFIADDRQN